MRPSNGLTPYPILAPFRDDYQGAHIAVDIDVQMTTEKLSLIVNFKLDDSNMLELIQRGIAKYAVHVECGSTSYRRLFSSTDSSITEEIPSGQLSNDFDVCTFVVAVDDIGRFNSPRFHPDYGEESFTVYRGNILAIGDSVNVEINESNYETPPSLIKITKGSERQEVNVQVNTDSDKYIVVSLEPSLYQLYLQMGEGLYSETVFSLILLPVLESVLSQMAQNQDDQDKYWFKTIEKLLKANDIALSDIAEGSSKYSALAVAQRIFEGPVLRSMQDLISQMETSNES